MNKILLGLLFLLVGLCAYAKDDKKVIYVGDGRYVCQGRDCGEFRALERFRQDVREREQVRDRTGYNESREQRQRERDSTSYEHNPYLPVR